MWCPRVSAPFILFIPQIFGQCQRIIVGILKKKKKVSSVRLYISSSINKVHLEECRKKSHKFCKLINGDLYHINH